MGDGLDQIKDLKLIIQIMDSLGISTEGLNSVDEMKAKIRDYLVESGMKRVSEVSNLFLANTVAHMIVWKYCYHKCHLLIIQKAFKQTLKLIVHHQTRLYHTKSFKIPLIHITHSSYINNL